MAFFIARRKAMRPSKLLCDVLGNQVRIQLRPLDFIDEDLDFLGCNVLQLFFQLRDLLAAPADDDTRTRGMDRDHCPLRRSVDLNS